VQTTTIGAFPKPGYVPITDWFTNTDGDFTGAYLRERDEAGEDLESLLDRATAEVVADQVEAGIDIPTDGEIRRENYIHYQCRHFDGIDFERLTPVQMRGTTDSLLPTVTGRIGFGSSPLAHDFEVAQASTARPVKMTIPGPMTIIDSTADEFYEDDPALAADLAAAINRQITSLVDAGATWIQVDEPVMARKPDLALAWGIDTLARCFEDVPPHVTRVTHACCGYPNHLDQPDYVKAPIGSYLEIAEALDAAPIDAISIEDAHRHNDLTDLLPRFANSTVIFGAVAIATSQVESVEQIRRRLGEAAELAVGGVIAAPDCGLGYLGRELAITKLRNLSEAAHSLR